MTTRRRILTPFLLVVALGAAGCGSLADEVVATVNGEDITIDQIEKVAGASEALGLGAAAASETPGRVPADARRTAINLYLQDIAFTAELERLGETPTPEDEQAAEQQLQGVNQAELDPDVLALVRRLVVHQAAVIRLSALESATVDDAAIEAYFEENREQFGEITCLDGLAGPPDATPAARAAIEAGTSFEDVVTSSSSGLQPIDQSGVSVCVPEGAIQDPGLGEAVYGTAPGAFAEYETQDNQGAPISLLLRITSRAPASLDDESVVGQIRQTLEQQATEAAQGESQQIFADVIARADVTIDPRYGSFDPESQTLIVAPPTPLPAGGAPSLPRL